MHTISLYSWPNTLLKEVEAWICNFIWSGDISKRKLVTVSWRKVCKPYSEGGLGLRFLYTLNEAANLKMCWDLKNSSEDWTILLRSKVFRGRKVISHHIFSSIWSSVKSKINNINENCSWIIGNGENINFWLDTWLDKPVASILNLPDTVHSILTARVSDYIHNSF